MVKLFSYLLVLPSASRFQIIFFRIAALALVNDPEEIVDPIAGSRWVDGFNFRTSINPLTRALRLQLERTDQVLEEKRGEQTDRRFHR